MKLLAEFLCALGFLTRLPVPQSAQKPDARTLRNAVRFFPLVGALIGCLTAGVIWCAASLFPLPLAVLIGLAVELRLTGAMHEDAIADSCDAFGGGHSAEDVLRIMKDSRLGTYGSAALFMALALRVGSTEWIEYDLFYPAIIAAAAMGRMFIVLALLRIAAVPSRSGVSDAFEQESWVTTFCWSTLWLVPGVFLFAQRAPERLAISAILAALFLLWFAQYLRRRIGGRTGDTLGTVGLITQLIVLMCAVAESAG